MTKVGGRGLSICQSFPVGEGGGIVGEGDGGKLTSVYTISDETMNRLLLREGERRKRYVSGVLLDS